MTTFASKPKPMPFPADARRVVRAVRGSFSELLTSIGADPGEPQSVARQLGLNKNLAWKISKIVQTDDPAVVFQQMPGSSGIRILLRAIRKAGASAALLDAAQRAVDEFERLIEVHSGDRATLEMLCSSLSPSGNQQTDEHHRKLLFQGSSYVWGVQARTILKVGVVGPGREPGLLDFASLSALIDFRRLRPDVSWLMAARHANNDDGTDMPTSRFEAIDPCHDRDDCAPIMEDFCSKPLPELRRHVQGTWSSFELTEGPVGNTGALTFVAGTIQRHIPYYRSPTNEWGEHSARCDTPAELLIVDLFFHESFDFAMEPETLLFSTLGAGMPNYRRERHRLPLHEPLKILGAGPLPLATPEVRQYNQMVKAMFDRTAWSPTQFHGFRMKIAYPACPTVLMLRYRLPEAPSSSVRHTS